MATRTLYLTSATTASPFPTTSRLLNETANASEVTLGPGEFDSGIPGTTDAGQWNPSSPLGNTTASAELDAAGASVPGTTRQGWLYDVDLTGQQLAAGTWTVQLRIDALQGGGAAGRIMLRVTVVRGNAGAWETIANLLTTNIVGEASHDAGEEGWRAQTEARIAPTTTPGNFSVTFDTGAAHTFAADERILVELGFGDADSATDRTWALLYNTSNSFVTTPDIALGAVIGDFNVTQGTQSSTTDADVSVEVTSMLGQDAQTSTTNTDAVVTGNASVSQVADTIVTDVNIVVTGDTSAFQAADTISASAVLIIGPIADLNQTQATQTSTADAVVPIAGASTLGQGEQIATTDVDVAIVGTSTPGQGEQTTATDADVAIVGEGTYNQGAQNSATDVDITVLGTTVSTQDAASVVAAGVVEITITGMAVLNQASNNCSSYGRPWIVADTVAINDSRDLIIADVMRDLLAQWKVMKDAGRMVTEDFVALETAVGKLTF